ncbi:MAG TPA: ABC transporter permease, partial [Thermoguttaceae bacterium]|nr:ABC transporter permease [Thermoguttaceae bacterium]
MFWVVLALSALVVIAFALVGINDTGLKVVVWQFDSDFFNAKLITPAVFYKFVFVNIGIGFWLSWIATVLALISTAGIFPDLITSGSIDLLCSKPIGRFRLFLTQYVAGLLFVTLQVTVFCGASFLVIGMRGGQWEPGLFIAVPLIVCFFSYLFAMCVFLGILTRSTMAALLLTLLFWFAIWLLGTAEQTLLMFRTMEEEKVEWVDMQHGPGRAKRDADRRAKQAEQQPVATTDSKEDNSEADTTDNAEQDKNARVLRALRTALVKGLTTEPPDKRGSSDESQTPATETPDESSDFTTLAFAHNIVYGIKTVLPKTTETISLLERELIDRAELPQHPRGRTEKQSLVAGKMEETLHNRSVGWIVGTSLLFELVVLAVAARIFCRRDY